MHMMLHEYRTEITSMRYTLGKTFEVRKLD
jgi:hypothetical protein